MLNPEIWRDWLGLMYSDITMKKVLFSCVHNSGWSKMAEALFNYLAEGKALATLAGTKPAAKVNPTVIEAMREVGVGISNRRPKLLTLEILESFDRVINMGCSAEGTCPASFIPVQDCELEDPEGKPLGKVRQIRDEVKARVEELVKEFQ